MFAPSIQKAGQMPCPRGTRMRASKRPYACANSPLVLSRVDVYRQLPYQHVYADDGGSARAVITRWPWPSRATFSGRVVVELPLLVAKAVSAGVHYPLRAVEGRARRSVELVLPDRT